MFIGRDFGHSKLYSEEIAAEIDQEVHRIIEECYHKAIALLEEHMDQLHAVSHALLEREVLDHDEFAAVMEEKKQTEEE